MARYVLVAASRVAKRSGVTPYLSRKSRRRGRAASRRRYACSALGSISGLHAGMKAIYGIYIMSSSCATAGKYDRADANYEMPLIIARAISNYISKKATVVK